MQLPKLVLGAAQFSFQLNQNTGKQIMRKSGRELHTAAVESKRRRTSDDIWVVRIFPQHLIIGNRLYIRNSPLTGLRSELMDGPMDGPMDGHAPFKRVAQVPA